MSPHMNNPADASQQASDSTRHMVEQVTEAAKEGVSGTREAASHALGKVQQGLEAAEQKITPAIEDIAARAQDWATRGIHFCADSTERARRQVQHATEATSRYVVNQPGKALMLAAAAGAAVATALLWGTRSRH